MNTTVQRIQMLKCPACGQMTLHPQRKALGYHVCVNCSSAKPVVGITTVEGTGDHTYNDIIIMDQNKAKAIAVREAELNGNLDTDESMVSQSVKEAVNNVLEDEETPFNTFDPNEEKQGIEGIDY